MRSLLRLIAACGGLLALSAAPAAAAPSPPAPASLNAAKWEFKIEGGVWMPVTLPHVFDPTPDETTFAGQSGDYRLKLRAPQAAAGFDWGIRFEQIRRVATIFLDGRRVATHRDPYSPFTVALPALGDGRVHDLAIHVDNRKAKEPREGWWNWGGITRQAQLVPLGRLVSHDAGFLPRRRCTEDGACRWSVLVDTVLEQRGRGVAAPKVVAAVRTPDGELGRRIATVRPLAAGERARVRVEVPVPGEPQLWSPNRPTLYRASLQTLDGSALQDTDSARVGLRWVDVRDGLLRLNGRQVALRGASIQEDVDGRGPAMTDEDIETIIGELKGLHANVTRAHYALDERLLRRFDEAGILVWSQAPIYHRDKLLLTPAQRAEALAVVHNTVLAARNHPAVITHSVANELSVIPDETPGTAAFLREARATTLDLDPTLPTSVDTLSYPGFPRQEAYAKFDLLGINSYFGWYPGKVDHSTANLGDFKPYLASMRRMYPQQGLVVTEFGAESTYEGPADIKETFAFQEDYVRAVIQGVDESPTISGAIYWTLREFAVKPQWDGGAQRTDVVRDGIHNKGLIAYGGRPKPAYGVLRDDIKDTKLDRSPAEVALATGIPLPRAERGGVGAGLAIAIVGLVALLLAVDVWAVTGWLRITRAELDDERARREALLAAAAAGDRPQLQEAA